MNKLQPLRMLLPPGRQVWFRRLIAGLVLGMLPTWGIFTSLALPVAAALVKQQPLAVTANHIVISEFRTIGLMGGNDEFIEIFNPTNISFLLNGWKIKKATR